MKQMFAYLLTQFSYLLNEEEQSQSQKLVLESRYGMYSKFDDSLSELFPLGLDFKRPLWSLPAGNVRNKSSAVSV